MIEEFLTLAGVFFMFVVPAYFIWEDWKNESRPLE
jgi:hypothetical protein